MHLAPKTGDNGESTLRGGSPSEELMHAQGDTGDSETGGTSGDCFSGKSPEDGAHPRWLWDGGRTVGEKEENIPAAMSQHYPGLDDRIDNMVFSMNDLQAIAAHLHAFFFAVDVGKGPSHELLYHHSLTVPATINLLPPTRSGAACDTPDIDIQNMSAQIIVHIFHECRYTDE